MIKKLQSKFIMIAMASVFIVIVLLIGSINIANFTHTTKKADDLLSMLAENNGRFPEGIEKEGLKPPKKEGNVPITPETKFETRYFAIYANETYDIFSIDTGHIAAVSASEAREYGESVLTSGKNKGYMEHYRYIHQVVDGTHIVVFLDCNQDLSFVTSFFTISCIIGLIGFLGIFLLIFLFSKRAINPVIDSMVKQKQFITDAGHEIKTPLAIISANAEVMEMIHGKSEWSESILNQVNRLNELVKRLLMLARLEEEKETVSFRIIDFSEIIQRVGESFFSIATQKEVHFTINVEPHISVKGDTNHLTELVSILLDNSLKYVNHGGVVRIHLKKIGKQTILEVYNSCNDIPEGDVSQWFCRFYREDQSRSRESGGYGIGLSIAYSIVEAHGGSIEAIKKDGGVCIQVTL